MYLSRCFLPFNHFIRHVFQYMKLVLIQLHSNVYASVNNMYMVFLHHLDRVPTLEKVRCLYAFKRQKRNLSHLWDAVFLSTVLRSLVILGENISSCVVLLVLPKNGGLDIVFTITYHSHNTNPSRLLTYLVHEFSDILRRLGSSTLASTLLHLRAIPKGEWEMRHLLVDERMCVMTLIFWPTLLRTFN